MKPTPTLLLTTAAIAIAIATALPIPTTNYLDTFIIIKAPFIPTPSRPPAKSLYTWPSLQSDVLPCCPKYDYACADRKPICVSLF
ncbi:hypothetical protein P280DRAFT_466212 [Massarina eburnea CBS 473.64]|uniref:Uncharacterized protein n=1 Tax=Massarina eburnea CBS 473.64 TaxID=1395130 RepID=A0A6A6SDL7_9PLEO|nr:hypothetical protein P280DRAFT_466212 [Massarina eburnea CBS 473.64]